MTFEEYCIKRKQPEWEWHLVVDNRYANNLCKIHPLQQKATERICEYATNHSELKKIIIFGSSTTYLCNSCSDLDVYVEWSRPYRDEEDNWEPFVTAFMKYLREVTNSNGYDLIFEDEVVTDRFRENIMKGVVVYE